MKRRLVLVVLIVFVAGVTFGQDVVPTPAPPRKRGWLSRMLHPFSPNIVPQYKDPRLRGLALDLQITPQTVKWSENHAIADKPGTLLINPSERIEYNETISTRELTPNKVFVAEVFFPQFLELRIRQKFLAVP